MPKVNIGEKQIAGEDAPAKKVFNNGHKSFTAMEAKVLTETQTRERRASETFERTKAFILKPRDPLVGEPTPRREYNPAGDLVGETGMLLLPPDRSPGVIPTTTTKALTHFSRRRVGGNDKSFKEDGNPLHRPDLATERITSLQNLQDNMGGEIEYLKDEIRRKQELLRSLRPL